MRARSVGLWHGGWDAHGVTTSCEFFVHSYYNNISKESFQDSSQSVDTPISQGGQ